MKTFAQAWAERGGSIPTKHAPSQYGYETSSPVATHNPYAARSAYFGRPVKTAPMRNIIPSRSSQRTIMARNEYFESMNAAFHKCVDQLEKFAHTSRYGG